MNKRERGEILEPVLILIGLLIVFVLYVIPAGAPKEDGTKENFRENSGWSNSNRNDNFGENTSIYGSLINIGSGNSAYNDDPFEEYITLTNNGEIETTLTGWTLSNAKGERPFVSNRKLYYPMSDYAVIPEGVISLAPTGQNTLSPIVLKRGETAIVTTGYIGGRSEIPIVSFKENKCTGYLEETADYSFTPNLRRNCSDPTLEPGFIYLDPDCKDFIRGMSRCHIPQFDTRSIYGEACRNCVDGREGLTNSCRSFLKDHFSYEGCLAYHSSDLDFEGRGWRVFLGKDYELWAEENETIRMFDQFGELIDSLSY